MIRALAGWLCALCGREINKPPCPCGNGGSHHPK